MTAFLGSRPHVLLVAALLGGVACQRSASTPFLSPTAPSAGATESSIGAARLSSAADLSACLSASGRSCFTAAQWQSRGAEPVTGPPINLTATVSGTTVTLTWTQPAFQDAPVISYLIDVGSTPNFLVPDLVSIDTFSAATTLEASGVAFGTYYARVRARNALGVSAPSNEIPIVVGAIAVPGCPGAPRSLTGGGTGGTVTLSWLPPLTGVVQSYFIEAGSSPGAANLVAANNGPSTSAVRAGVPPGIYYVRVRSVAPGCAISAPSNEVGVTVSGPSTGSPSVNLTLAYFCNPCSGDPDNYALNVDCVNGRCSIFRTSNATRSGTITASVRMTPGVHNVEVVVRTLSAPWRLTITGGRPPATVGMTPGSWKLLFPENPGPFTFGSCHIDGRSPEAFFEFTLSNAVSAVC